MAYRKHKPHVKKIQSILGSLLYVYKCVKPARMFVNQMLFTLRSAPASGYVQLSVEFRKDNGWFASMLQQFNGKFIFDKSAERHNEILHVDVCLKGMGPLLEEYSLSLHHPSYIVLDKKLFIVYEMLNVLIGLRLWADCL